MKTSDKVIYGLLFFIIYFAMLYNRHEFNELSKKVNQQDSLFNDLYYSIVDTMEKESYLVHLTTYNATQKQTDNTPNKTSAQFKIDMKNPFTQKFIGLSRDLLEDFKYGEIVKIENAGMYNGYYIVADCMNSRFLRTVDILINNNQKHTKLSSVVLKHANKDE